MTQRELPVTAIISTKNEERAIRSCIESVRPFGEVIVVDSNSTDDTQAIAESLGAQVVNFTWNGRYPKKKQWCLENLATRYQWILFVDADERPSEAMLSELRKRFHRPPKDIDAFDVRLEYFFAGRRLRGGHTVVKRCLMKRDRARFPELPDLDAPGMGELEGHYQPIVAGKTARLNSRLIHEDPDPFSTWIARHNSYSDWEAYLRTHPTAEERTRRLRSKQGQLFARVPGKPLAFFIYTYILRGGFIDGRAGLDYSLALAFYYWTIDVKVREIQRMR